MASARVRLLRRLILVLSVWFAIDARSDAAPYYTATDVGRIEDGYDIVGQTVVNPQTGVAYPFVVTTTPTSTVDTQNLPGVNGFEGTTYTQKVFFPMSVVATNSSGTVLGGVPYGSSLAFPYSSLIYGYATPTRNGQFSSFVPISSHVYGGIYLSQSNEIFYNQKAGGPCSSMSIQGFRHP